MCDIEEDAPWSDAGTGGQDWADLEEEVEGEREDEGQEGIIEEWGRLFEGKVEWADIISDEEDSDQEYEPVVRTAIPQRSDGRNHNAQQSPPRSTGGKSNARKKGNPPTSTPKGRNARGRKNQQQASPPRGAIHTPPEGNKRKGQRATPNSAPVNVWRQVIRSASPAEATGPVPQKALFQDERSVEPFELPLHSALVERMRRIGLGQGHALRHSSNYLNKAISAVLEGKNLVALGEDRAGEKTVAYALPVLQKIFYPICNSTPVSEQPISPSTESEQEQVQPDDQPIPATSAGAHPSEAAKRSGVQALVLSPSHDAIDKIRSVIESLSPHNSSPIASISITEDAKQHSFVRKGHQEQPILIASPAQVLAALKRGEYEVEDFEGLDTIILDDVEKMLSTPVLQKILETFGLITNNEVETPSLQIRRDVRKIVISTHDDLSMSMRNFVGTTLGGFASFSVLRVDGVEISVNSDNQMTIGDPLMNAAESEEKEQEKEKEKEGEKEVRVSLPPQGLYPVPKHLKVSLLVEMLRKGEGMESVLVLARLRPSAKQLVLKLRKNGIRALYLGVTGDDGALEGYKGGDFQLLVATNLAAPELQERRFSHIINYDVPPNADAYSQRVTRTDHLLTLMIPEESHIMETIEKVIGQEIERSRISGMDYERQKGERKALKRMQQQQHQHHHQQQLLLSRTPVKGSGPHKQHPLSTSKQKNQPHKQVHKQKKKEAKRLKQQQQQQQQHHNNKSSPSRAWGGGGGGSPARKTAQHPSPQRHTPHSPSSAASPVASSSYRYSSSGASDTWRRGGGGGSPAGGGGSGSRW